MAKKQKKKPRGRGIGIRSDGWILAVITALVAWVVGMLLPLRVTVLLSMVGIGISTWGMVASWRSMSKNKGDVLFPVWFGVWMVSVMGFIVTNGAYEYFREPFYPFWKPALILGFLIGVLVTVIWLWKRLGMGTRIGSIAVGTFLAFFVVLLSLCHLNFLLDFNPPVEHHAVIEEKEEDFNRKAPDTYSFRLTVDGESFKLEVDRIEYGRYDVGDTYTFYEYAGAFGKPFYARE